MLVEQQSQTDITFSLLDVQFISQYNIVWISEQNIALNEVK